MIKKHLHLQHHRHSGSALHHRHTSYRAIVAVLVLGGLFMIWLFYYSNNKAVVVSPNPSYEAPAPSIPFISSPALNSLVSVSNVKIEGTCSKDVQNYVTVRNLSKITGSATCSNEGTFSTTQPLLFGANIFTASSTNISGKETPISIGVAVNGIEGSIKNPVGFSSGKGAIFYTSKVEFGLPINLDGGSQPYKVTIDWGDNKKDVIDTKDSKIEPKHTYQGKSDNNIIVTVEGSKADSQIYSFVASQSNQKTNKLSAVAVTNGGSGGSSAPQFIRAFVFGFYVLLLAVFVPFARQAKYAPEIIEFDQTEDGQ